MIRISFLLTYVRTQLVLVSMRDRHLTISVRTRIIGGFSVTIREVGLVKKCSMLCCENVEGMGLIFYVDVSEFSTASYVQKVTDFRG